MLLEVCGTKVRYRVRTLCERGRYASQRFMCVCILYLRLVSYRNPFPLDCGALVSKCGTVCGVEHRI